MRKKTLAVLLAGAVAAAGIMGLTACKKDGGGNNGSNQAGEQVTEEQWKAAFNATLNAENYTLSFISDGTEVTKYTVDGNTVTENFTDYATGKLCFDYTHRKYGYENKNTETTTVGEEKSKETTERKSYFEVENLELWGAGRETEDTEWYAHNQKFTSAEEEKEYFFRYNGLSFLKYEYTLSAESTTELTLLNLYSAFTYKDGLYTASLYDEEGNVEAITICIKDGYIIERKGEVTFEDTYEREGVTYTTVYHYIETYTFSNYGTTIITAPEGAAAAIAAKKSTSNN